MNLAATTPPAGGHTLPLIGPGLVAGKSVIVRADLEADNEADPRFVATKTLVSFLREQNAGSVKVIGHAGEIWMVASLGVNVNYNLRADGREEENSMEFAMELAEGFDVYINEAFGTSHRKHASIDALPRFMKSRGKEVYCGPRFAREVEVLSTITSPGVLVVGGTKIKDKAKYADSLQEQGWTVLRGGLLPGADLRADGLDISNEAISKFKPIIAEASQIVAAGVMGKYEDEQSERGTKEILTAICESRAKKIAGGGDIEAAIAKYGLTNKFDWISVGGGAMLEFLATGTLPGIRAIAEL